MDQTGDADIMDTTIEMTVRVRLTISLWEALKFRIAGIDVERIKEAIRVEEQE